MCERPETLSLDVIDPAPQPWALYLLQRRDDMASLVDLRQRVAQQDTRIFKMTWPLASVSTRNARPHRRLCLTASTKNGPLLGRTKTRRPAFLDYISETLVWISDNGTSLAAPATRSYAQHLELLA